MRLSAAALLLCSLTCARGQMGRPPTLPSVADQSQPVEAPSGATQSDVVYSVIGHHKQKLDVYLPSEASSTPVPAIILIHGGAWLGGDKSMLAAMARFLARHGYAAFSINYRLHDGKSNRWPAQLDDAQTAVRWVRAHAAEYHADPSRIGAWGHSAGAQIASLLGELDTRDPAPAEYPGYSSRVQAVVDVSGPVDFLAIHDPDGDAMFASLLGATAQQRPDVWKAASPVFNTTSHTAPFLIVHGTRDADVPINQSVEFANALLKAGVDVSLVQVDDAHTFETEAAKKRLALETLSFFNRTLAPAK